MEFITVKTVDTVQLFKDFTKRKIHGILKPRRPTEVVRKHLLSRSIKLSRFTEFCHVSINMTVLIFSYFARDRKSVV